MTNRGNSIPAAAVSNSLTDADGADDASAGRPAVRAAAMALALLPVNSRTPALGPTNVMPAAAHAAASWGFSERNPYPGYTASAPDSWATRMMSGTDR